VLADAGRDRPAEEPGDAADDQVRRALRARWRRRDLRAIDDVDVRGEERGRDLRLAETREERAVEIAARIHVAPQQVVLGHVVREAPREQPLLRELPLQL